MWLLLFSDLLLITRKDGKIFTVQEEPILMDDLQLSDSHGPSMNTFFAYILLFHCTDCTGTELQLFVKDKVCL